MAEKEVWVERLGVALGAQVHGIDLRRPVADGDAGILRRALDEYQVIVVRGQDGMTTEEQTVAAAIFGVPGGGEPMRTLALLNGTTDEVAAVQIRSVDRRPHTDRWHADVTYSASPPTVGTLFGELMPKVGGDTAFVSLQAIYDALSEPIKTLCEGLQGEHSLSPMIRDGYPVDARTRALFPDRCHPLVSVHPNTGRKAVMIGAEDTWLQRIVGLTKDEGRMLLDHLRRQLDNIEFQFRWRWRSGDFLVWDQRAVNHMGMGDHYALDPNRIVRSIWCYADANPAAYD